MVYLDGDPSWKNSASGILLLWIFPLFLVILLSIYFKFSDHKIRIRRIGPWSFSIGDVLYSRISTESLFTCSEAAIHPHFPRPSAPYWATCTVHNVEYKDADCHVYIADVEVTLWIFPVLFKRTAGPWATIRLEDFRVRVFRSTYTPYHIQEMRRNLVAAVLTGDVLQLDDFSTKLKFGGASKILVKGEDAEDRNTPTDEVQVSATAKGYRILNKEGRHYTFGGVVAQLRRDWAQGTGSFTMIAEKSKWERIPRPSMRVDFPVLSRLALTLFQVPFDFFMFYQHPMTFFDLHVERADITFDEFRIRDAELVVQGLKLLEQHARRNGFGTVSEVGNLLFDMMLYNLKT